MPQLEQQQTVSFSALLLCVCVCPRVMLCWKKDPKRVDFLLHSWIDFSLLRIFPIVEHFQEVIDHYGDPKNNDQGSSADNVCTG